MDPHPRGFSGSTDGIQLGNKSLSVLSNQNPFSGPRFKDSFFDHEYRGEYHFLQPGEEVSHMAPSSAGTQGEDSPEDCDFSDTVLGFISQILMEEGVEDKSCMLQDSLELQAAEKSFYELLGKKYPPSPLHRTNGINGNGESTDDNHYVYHSNYASSTNSSSCFGDNSSLQNNGEYTSQLQTLPFDISKSSTLYPNIEMSSVDGLVDFPSSNFQVPDSNNKNHSIWQFRKGVEEASKFLPPKSKLFFNLDANELLLQKPKAVSSKEAVKVEMKEEGEYSPTGSRGKKHPHGGEDNNTEDERLSKQAAVYIESTLRFKFLDMVLLSSEGEGKAKLIALQETLQNGKSKNVQHNGISKYVPRNGQSKGSNGGRGRGKKQSRNKEVVDLRTLLIHCSQAVAADDQRSANEMLKQIRQHSTPFGDGNQRLAHIFADGLEARLAGTGSQIYKGLVNKRTSAVDILKAYHLYLAACPFRKISNFISNKTIKNEAVEATSLHVIDFGILYGFQWPTLIQRLSWRPGGPPKLRITGIDFPQPGFRPAERVEETGRRLATYAESFNVPFEYHAIAKKWETIRIEEIKINKDEFIVVNCLYRGKNLRDESMSVEGSRDAFLSFVRKINPGIFIHGVVNGAFNAPFFVTRLREALFHYSALFDMLETVVPRENLERMLIEKEIFGWEALNVIACEGWERVERPETYKQWQVRNLRAGFAQLPFDRELVKAAMAKVRSSYHKDFVIDEDSRWLLQGWKGRTTYALSCWKPA